ncbi:MAG: Tar ligand binding domain-containing protein [Gaiellales bacterium]
MTIRTKLYAAIVVTVLGLTVVAGVGIWGMSRVGDRFDAVQAASTASAIALQLKFDVTDYNGWQTAYGYDDGQSRPQFLRSVARFNADRARAHRLLTGAAERPLLRRIDDASDDFMRLDAEAYGAVRAGRAAEVKRLLLGPEIVNFHRAAAAAQGLAGLEGRTAAAENARFRDTRRDALRLLLIAALVTGLFVIILLLTANDVAKAAEGRIEDPPADGPE